MNTKDNYLYNAQKPSLLAILKITFTGKYIRSWDDCLLEHAELVCDRILEINYFVVHKAIRIFNFSMALP